MFESQAFLAQLAGFPLVGVPVDEVLEVGVEQAVHPGFVLGDGFFQILAFCISCLPVFGVQFFRAFPDIGEDFFAQLDALKDAFDLGEEEFFAGIGPFWAEFSSLAMGAAVVDVAALKFRGYLAAALPAGKEVPESEEVLALLVSVAVGLECLLDLLKEF